MRQLFTGKTFTRIYFLILLLFIESQLLAQQWNVVSPGKEIKVNIVLDNGALFYDVSFKGHSIVQRSPLGINRDDQAFSKELKSINVSRQKINDSYTLMVGKKLNCRNSANELTLAFVNSSGARIDITFRAYQDGVAYRYHFPDQDNTIRKIVDEKSGFKISANASAWIQPYDLNVRMKPCYETYYENDIKPGTPSPNPAGWAFPALFKIDDNWLLITEAGLDEHYCATHLEDKNNNGLYSIRFSEKEEVTSLTDPEPLSSLPWSTPWRVLVIGSSLSVIEETSLVTDVSPPSKLKDTSWIKPGRASWSWWSVGSSARDYDAQVKYVDFTASMGWEYVLIDADGLRWERTRSSNLYTMLIQKE
jgi:hypothetical protein